MRPCPCRSVHRPRRIVLTGGPGAGKTAVLELVRQSFCEHVEVLPEAAGLVFGGGFPRRPMVPARKAAQRAIFHVQHELEEAVAEENRAIVLCDRGTVDGIAYWPGPEVMWAEVGSSLEEQLARYHAVVHLRVPGAHNGYNTHTNPLRVESAEEAAVIDEKIAHAWRDHPRRFTVPARPEFLSKAFDVIAILRSELPECCAPHTLPTPKP